MSSCIVSGCKSGYKTKANEGKKWHMFYPPKNDPDLFATWEQLCRPKGQTLSAKHRVCHKHFPDEMLVTQINIPLQDGCIYQSKLEYWRLKPGAFPCIFDGCGPGAAEEQPRVRGVETKKTARKRRRSKTAAAAASSSEDGSTAATTSAAVEKGGTMEGERRALQRKARAAASTQTEMDWFVVRGGEEPDTPQPKRPVLQERAKGQSGVFVPFAGLTGREKKYLMSIARKSSVRTADEGCDDEHTCRGNL